MADTLEMSDLQIDSDVGGGAEVVESTDQPSHDPMEAFERALEGGDDEAAAEEVAESDAGNEVEETKVPETKVADGPSVAMRQLAKLAGVSERAMAIAQSDEQLQVLIEDAESRASKESPEPEAAKEPKKDELLDWDLDLPEDEFPADAPERKVMEQLRDKVKAAVAEQRRVASALVKFATEQLDRQEQQQQATQAEVVGRLQKPFDAALDSYESDVLGRTSGTIDAKTAEQRIAVWNRAVALGMTETTPAEEVERLTHLAVEAMSADLAKQRQEKLRAARQQPRKTLGGRGARAVEPPESEDEKLNKLEEALLGKRSWESLYKD